MMNRRQFLATSAGLVAAASLPSFGLERRKRIAFVGTVVREYSHAQHFLDRLAMGQAWGGHWLDPRLEVAGVYIDQFPEEGDLGKERIARYGLTQYPTIAEALCLGGSQLAVDGVVIIAEHGHYPRNDKRQTLYPRYKWFKEVVQVFEASGRAVPVFNDKHLSTSWDECAEMVADSRRLGFPFLAGSSLPVTWRLPGIDMPYGAKVTESVSVAYGGVDSYDFHALETAQCMSERRRGGEVGITQVQALRGDRLWDRLESDERRLTRELFVAGLTRSHNLPVEGGYPSAPVSLDWARRTFDRTTGYFVEHRDGFRTSIFLTGIRDFNYAGYLSDKGEILSCQMYLPMPTHGSTTADFFSPLVRHIEDMILTGRAPYPVERTLLTSGMVIGGVESLYRGQEVVPTPEMAVAYKVPKESMFWRV
ncbi:MAG: twin-arginine translocation signal domain-containing protein [Gemmatimonadota bacterium]